MAALVLSNDFLARFALERHEATQMEEEGRRPPSGGRKKERATLRRLHSEGLAGHCVQAHDTTPPPFTGLVRSPQTAARPLSKPSDDGFSTTATTSDDLTMDMESAFNQIDRLCFL